LLQTIGDVLDACGNNIDVAIKQLGQLRLTAHCGTAQPAPSGTGPAANLSAPAGGQAAGKLSGLLYNSISPSGSADCELSL